MSIPIRFVVITGMSGAGKTHALRAFEDQGFFCVDNLPSPLLETFARLMLSAQPAYSRVAVCIDARTGADLAALPKLLKNLSETGFMVEVLFLDAQDDVLHRRYSETRRPHPAAPGGSIADGIAREREVLGPVRERADLVVDTSEMNTATLKRHLQTVAGGSGIEGTMRIVLLSFGFKHGPPKEADLVFDVRFLPNPHYDETLGPRDGRDADVRSFVLDNDTAQAFLFRLTDLLDFLIPQYAAEPKSYLTIAIGCTGGRHRSIAVSEALARHLGARGHDVLIKHRDVGNPA
jgi:UPF0042 nucleotide-binding protein